MKLNPRIANFLKIVFLIWGVISFIGVIVIASILLYQLEFGNKPELDEATKSDVRFVLNWPQLGDDRIQAVEHSLVSGRSFTGDYLDAYVIKVSHLSDKELKNNKQIWFAGDSLPKTVSDALKLAGSFQHQIKWFPKESEIRTKNFYVYLWSVGYYGLDANSTEIILANPSEKKLYYFGTKM